MTKYVVDAYAWMEYLGGTAKGTVVREIIFDNKNEAITSSVTVAEVVSVVLRRGFDCADSLEAIRRLSTLHIAEETLAEEAGRIHAELRKKMKDFGLADAFVLASAKQLKAKILTGDPHFKKLKNVHLLS
jgi:PIN domain nuclease of toxin-antitoxin system